MRRKTTPPPADTEILALNDVPVELAAAYIGKSTPTIYAALQDERAPFGFAVQNKGTGTWTYSISPGALVKYKHGELPVYRLNEIQAIMAQGVEQMLSAKLGGMKKVLEAVMGA